MKKPSLSSFLFIAAALAAPAAPASDALPDPLDLRGAIFYALDHNYAILQSRQQIKLQEGIVLQAQGPSIPNVSATAGYQRNAAAITQTYPPETSEWVAELKASQILYAGGGVHASVRSAELSQDAALFDLQSTIDAALLDVRTKFYTVLLDREKVKVQEENVRLFERQLQDARNQFKAGSVSSFEVLRAQVSLANAQPDLITARNDYRISMEQLRQSLGASPPSSGPSSSGFPEVSGALEFSPETFELESALSSAHEHRPELLRLGKLEEAGVETVQVARSNYYPNLSVFGAYEFGGAGLASGGSYNANGYLFGLQSSWSIFDGRATAGKVRQSRAQLEQTKIALAEEQLAVDVDVRQALSSFQEATELVSASQKTVEQAVEALRLADSRYKAGAATQLDVLTSQVSLTQARTNALQADYSYLVSLAGVRKAIGLNDAFVER